MCRPRRRGGHNYIDHKCVDLDAEEVGRDGHKRQRNDNEIERLKIGHTDTDRDYTDRNCIGLVYKTVTTWTVSAWAMTTWDITMQAITNRP